MKSYAIILLNMKIGIDVFGGNHGRSGIGSYLNSIVSNIPEDISHQVEIFGSEIDRYDFNKNKKFSFYGFSMEDGSLAEKLWHIFTLPSFVRKREYDVVLYNVGSNISPFVGNAKGVAVVQEVISKSIKKVDNIFIKKSLISSLNKATKIIAASQFIRKDLVSLGIDNEKISVIHNGLNHSYFYPHTELEGETVNISPFSIKRPFFIYASRLSGPEKKHIELIKAFSMFKKKTGLPHRLVLAGSEGSSSKEIHKVIAHSEYSSDILLVGHFPHVNLPKLYSCAEACIFPSVAEGVGLPVIEAMATGIPVLCAKAGSLPEIAGECAVYFDPDNIDELSNLMIQITEDTKLRKKIISSGLDWVKRFSWEKTATKTIEVLESVVKS